MRLTKLGVAALASMAYSLAMAGTPPTINAETPQPGVTKPSPTPSATPTEARAGGPGALSRKSQAEDRAHHVEHRGHSDVRPGPPPGAGPGGPGRPPGGIVHFPSSPETKAIEARLEANFAKMGALRDAGNTAEAEGLKQVLRKDFDALKAERRALAERSGMPPPKDGPPGKGPRAAPPPAAESTTGR